MLDVGRAVDIVYLQLSKVFDPVFHNILINKLTGYGLSEVEQKLAEGPGSEGCDQWHEVQLEANH